MSIQSIKYFAKAPMQEKGEMLCKFVKKNAVNFAQITNIFSDTLSFIGLDKITNHCSEVERLDDHLTVPGVLPNLMPKNVKKNWKDKTTVEKVKTVACLIRDFALVAGCAFLIVGFVTDTPAMALKMPGLSRTIANIEGWNVLGKFGTFTGIKGLSAYLLTLATSIDLGCNIHDLTSKVNQTLEKGLETTKNVGKLAVSFFAKPLAVTSTGLCNLAKLVPPITESCSNFISVAKKHKEAAAAA